jgi:hypothetical protein
MRFTVETWAPEYGSSIDPDVAAGDPEATVDLGVELPAASWRPLAPDPALAPARSVLFVDGVRRIDARIWVDVGGASRMGLCASYAAGVVRCGERAEIEAVEVERAVLAPGAVDEIVLARAGVYRAVVVADDDMVELLNELQRRLGLLEVRIAAAAGAADLTIVDGHLRGREEVPGAVGFIKSHRSSYLEAPARDVVGQLAPGERTPLFVTQTSWSRWSWYLRLPPHPPSAPGEASRSAPPAHPWAGVVRCELASTVPLEEARRQADRVAATLPRYASAPHKDPRAPQNLYPIGGLERELRRRLGDQQLLYRDLLQAAAG